MANKAGGIENVTLDGQIDTKVIDATHVDNGDVDHEKREHEAEENQVIESMLEEDTKPSLGEFSRENLHTLISPNAQLKLDAITFEQLDKLGVLVFEDFLPVLQDGDKSKSGSIITSFSDNVVHCGFQCIHVKSTASGSSTEMKYKYELDAYVYRNRKHLKLCELKVCEILTELKNSRSYYHSMELTHDDPLMENSNNYLVSVDVQKDKERVKTSGSFIAPQAMLFNGSNLVFERSAMKLQLLKEGEKTSFHHLDSYGKLGILTYNNLGKKSRQIGEDIYELICIQKELFFLKEIPLPKNPLEPDAPKFRLEPTKKTWQLFFFPDGHLCCSIQMITDIVFQVDTVPDLILEEDEHLERPTIAREEIDWQEDAQLRSQYLDRKDQYEATDKSYIENHPEVTQILSDFTQALLLNKPDKPIAFAAKYFNGFSHTQKRETSFANSQKRVPFEDVGFTA